MAVEVLRRGIIHQVRHDLESFYWLLLWLVLRHTKHRGVDTYHQLRALFDHATDQICAQMKKGWFGNEVEVIGNPPLTKLLDAFSLLCADNSGMRNSIPPHQPLTYDRVLRLFDDSLARTDWPEGDAAIPFKPGVLLDKTHLERKSTWFTTEDSPGSQERPGPLSLQPALATLFASAAPGHGGSDGAARLAWTAGRSARADGYPPRTPERTANSRLRHPIQPLSTLPRYRSDAGSPSPSLRSRRGSSAASRMQPPTRLPRAPLPSPAFSSLIDRAEVHMQAGSGEDSQSSGSSRPMPSESSNAKRSGRKRSHEELAMNDEAPEKEPSKRSRTHSGQTVPSLKALGKRRMDGR
ncbi:hypothetical protein DAEQUDRAFT_172354 [Daedalea quercina L-15889]|uniref:Fungal-type protein kinase domain-containing protein n=1 Tax=Daedalea quercina L-15889 TaxID=1314783 RepID=A0A165KJG6_9APHY|nr:hypothetical protein DAEQUDRAFT_172354 [Daedalea quercina L-15889]